MVNLGRKRSKSRSSQARWVG